MPASGECSSSQNFTIFSKHPHRVHLVLLELSPPSKPLYHECTQSIWSINLQSPDLPIEAIHLSSSLPREGFHASHQPSDASTPVCTIPLITSKVHKHVNYIAGSWQKSFVLQQQIENIVYILVVAACEFCQLPSVQMCSSQHRKNLVECANVQQNTSKSSYDWLVV